MDDNRLSKKNQEGYRDNTAFEAITAAEREKKAYYAFKTMISAARLAGFFVNDALVIEDHDGVKYDSRVILKKHRKDV